MERESSDCILGEQGSALSLGWTFQSMALLPVHVFPALFSFHLHHRHRTKDHEELEEVTELSTQNHQALSFMVPHYSESCECQTPSFPILAWLLS